MRTTLLALLLILTGCASTPDIERYADREPRFDPMTFFAGRTLAEGVFETRGGGPKRRFTQVIDGRMEGDVLVIDQVFTYEDGKVEPRTWRLAQIDETTYRAVSDAAAGPGTGRVYGDVFLWEWVYEARPGNPLANLNVRQWMYLHDTGRATNRAIVTKFGVQVAQITEAFVKPQSRRW